MREMMNSHLPAGMLMQQHFAPVMEPMCGVSFIGQLMQDQFDERNINADSAIPIRI
jgi:hypothetical protein